MRFIPLILISFSLTWAAISAAADTDAPAGGGKAFSSCLRAGPGKMFHGCFGKFKGESRREKGRHHSRLHEAKGGPGGRAFKEKWQGRGGENWREVRSARKGGDRASSGGGRGSRGQAVQSNGGGGYKAASALASFAEGYTARVDRSPSQAPNGQFQPNAVGPDGSLPDGNSPADPAEDPVADEPGGEAGFMAPAQLEAAISADLSDCMQSLSSAQICCGDPMSCRGRLSGGESQSLASVVGLLQRGPSAGGVADYCGQLTKAAQNSRDVNSGLAGVCFETQDSCETTCEDLRADYESFLRECNGCESAGTLQAAISRLDSAQKTCSSLTANVASLAENGFEAAAAQAVATHCQGVTSAQSASGASSSAPPALNEKLGATVSLDDPNQRRADGSSGKGPQVEMQVDASGGFKGYASAPKGGTQQPDAGSWSSGRPLGGAASTQAPKAGAGPGAAVSPGGAVAAHVAGPGGASATGKEGRGAAAKPKDGGESGREPASTPPAIKGNENQFAGQKSLDQYLPQGVRSAMRRLAHAKEINAKEENIFLRVSAKFREKCQLGVLWQCE